MGSATRNALAAATAQLDAVKSVKLATGEQLLGAGRAIAGSAQLRAVLSDRSIPQAEKSALIARIFTSLDATAAKLLGGIVESRWSDSDELVDGIEAVGIRAIAQAAGPDAGLEGGPTIRSGSTPRCTLRPGPSTRCTPPPKRTTA